MFLSQEMIFSDTCVKSLQQNKTQSVSVSVSVSVSLSFFNRLKYRETAYLKSNRARLHI